MILVFLTWKIEGIRPLARRFIKRDRTSWTCSIDIKIKTLVVTFDVIMVLISAGISEHGAHHRVALYISIIYT